MKQKLLLIGGSTAVGKSKFALELSKKLKICLISADSIQVYRNLDIGTSKPTEAEKQQCKHYLIDIIEPTKTFNAFDFVNEARKCIEEISKKGFLPVIVGGTGLYMESLLYAYSFKKEKENNSSIYDYKLYILNQDREKLYKRINDRVDIMIKNGLVDEVKKLKELGLNENSQSMQAIGYKEILKYLNNEISLDEAIEKIKQGTRNYAKRQITWFKHMNGKWIDVDNEWDIAQKEIIDYYSEYKI